jgi:GNAT superfamily N-acetyltransferase
VKWQQKFITFDKNSHDGESFDCLAPELNIFLQKYASKHSKLGISRTKVLPSIESLPNGKKSVCAFYSIAPSEISRETLPPQLGKKLPPHPVPVFLLAQLAVDKRCASKGLGGVTLVAALKDLLRIKNNMPSYAVIVDCLDDGALKFYEKYGFEKLCIHNERHRLFIPMTKIEQIP